MVINSRPQRSTIVFMYPLTVITTVYSLLTSFLLILIVPASGQISPTLWASQVPLAVRSPYFSAWLNAANVPLNLTQRAPALFPKFWSVGESNLGWVGHIRVDNNLTYRWLGSAATAGLQDTVITNIQITPTRTILNVTAGPINITITYLSPIEPSDPVLQSLPFAYYSVTTASNDGKSHEVQLYTDISSEWLSGDRTILGDWKTQVTNEILYHKTFLHVPQAFAEIQAQAQDSSVYLATLTGTNVTYQADAAVPCRAQFSRFGALTNIATSGPQIIDHPFTVYGISQDIGIVTPTPTNPVVWAIGLLRDPAIQFKTMNGQVEARSAFWRTKYTSDQDAITAFLQDYPHAVQRADTLDEALAKNASAVSSHYLDLVSLTAQRTLSSIELTVGAGADGAFNLSDTKMFMREIGGSGRVNPVEIMYSSFPLLLSLNASYGGWLLSPVLEFASSNAWNQSYAPRGAGINYPNATGDPSPHPQGVEQTGNMLIMALAHARASGDGSLLSQYYPLLKTWTDYLVNNTYPLSVGQVDADSLLVANSTNLIIKGIIAIKAMAQISTSLQQNSDANHYTVVANTFTNVWQSLALPSGSHHILSGYGASNTSYVLPYNLFADKWLGTGIVDNGTYSIETAFIRELLPSNPNGLPINSQVASDGSTAWTLFTAATMTDDNVRDAMIDQVWNFATRNSTSGSMFPTTFSLDGTGRGVSNIGSPGVGGVFAPLALALPNMTIIAKSPSHPSTSAGMSEPSAGGSGPSSNGRSGGKSNVASIAGGVIGGVGGAIVLALLGFLWWRRRRAHNAAKTPGRLSPHPFTRLGAEPGDYARRGSAPGDPSSGPGASTTPELAGLSVDVEGMRRSHDLQEDSAPPPTYREVD